MEYKNHEALPPNEVETIKAEFIKKNGGEVKVIWVYKLASSFLLFFDFYKLTYLNIIYINIAFINMFILFFVYW